MIKLIGAKRALLLGIVLAINLLIVAVYMFAVEPMRESEENNLRSANGRISKLAQDIQNVKMELASFPSNYAHYQELGQRGFFSHQDRFAAGRDLDTLKEKANLLGYSYKIDALKAITDPRVTASGGSLIYSRVTIDKVSALLDMNVYALMRSISSSFSQHARIGKFEIKRVKDIDETVLKSMNENPSALVEASIVFDWYTMPPPDSAETDPAQPGGFRGR